MGRVLIVDDDTDFVEVVRRRLTKAGHEAVAVTSGNVAFQVVVRHQPIIMMASQDNPQVKARSLSKGSAAPSHRAAPGRRIGI